MSVEEGRHRWSHRHQGVGAASGCVWPMRKAGRLRMCATAEVKVRNRVGNRGLRLEMRLEGQQWVHYRLYRVDDAF